MAAASEVQLSEVESELASMAGEYYGRPYEWVMAAFPWGEPGELEKEPGPEDWQRDFLIDWGEEIRERGFDGHTPVPPILMGVGSGHGVGKSTIVAWIILFIAATRPLCRGSVTASTGAQLSSKTLAELAKWKRLCLFGHWFSLRSNVPGKLAKKGAEEEWRVDFLTSSKENADAFQGQHAATSTSFYIFDEASGIDDKIDEVAHGGLTDGEPMYFKFGNRTQNVGHFNNIFAHPKIKREWLTYVVDSRTCRHTNKALIARWAAVYGEDSDFFRIRVLGLAPMAAAEQMISVEDINKAKARKATANITDPLVMGIDVARFGTHRSAFAYRKGRDMRTHPIEVFHGLDNMQLAEKAAEKIRELRPDIVNIDGGGVGSGVVDRLRQLGFDVNDVNFGSKSPDKLYYDMRTCMWGRLALAIKQELALPDDEELEQDLVAQEYFVDKRSRTQRCVAKEDMHMADGSSPDVGDAAALTYAFTIAVTAPDGGGGGAAGGLPGSIDRGRQNYNPHGRLSG